PGGSALSEFRARAVLRRLQVRVPRVAGVSAEHQHWVASTAPLTGQQARVLQQLLDYGEPVSPADPAAASATVVVTPRLGTISPWASKATDIVHNCGIAIHRVERVVHYTLALRDSGPLTEQEWADCAEVLHDRMTETALPGADGAAAL